MKIIAAAAIIALCGLSQISFSKGGLTELQNDIAHKQQVVWNVTKQLIDKQEDMLSSDRVDEDEKQFYGNVSLIIGEAKKSIQVATSTAIAAGKAAGPCGDTAAARIDLLNSTAFAEIELCEKNLTTFGISLLNNLNTVLVEGHKVGLYLASITPTCLNADLEKFTTCFADLSQNTTAQIKSYEAAAENIFDDPNALENVATVLILLSDRSECIKDAGLKGITESDKVKATATECIAAL